MIREKDHVVKRAAEVKAEGMKPAGRPKKTWRRKNELQEEEGMRSLRV